MAELLGDAVIKITVDATGAKQGLDAAEAKTKATVSAMENAMARLRGSMSRISESLKMPAISTVGTDALTRSIDQINAKATVTKQKLKGIYDEQIRLAQLSKNPEFIKGEMKAGRTVPEFDEGKITYAYNKARGDVNRLAAAEREYVETQGKAAAKALEDSLQEEMHRKIKHQSELDALREKELSKEIASKERIANVRERISGRGDTTLERQGLKNEELVRQANEKIEDNIRKSNKARSEMQEKALADNRQFDRNIVKSHAEAIKENMAIDDRMAKAHSEALEKNAIFDKRAAKPAEDLIKAQHQAAKDNIAWDEKRAKIHSEAIEKNMAIDKKASEVYQSAVKDNMAFDVQRAKIHSEAIAKNTALDESRAKASINLEKMQAVAVKENIAFDERRASVAVNLEKVHATAIKENMAIDIQRAKIHSEAADKNIAIDKARTQTVISQGKVHATALKENAAFDEARIKSNQKFLDSLGEIGNKGKKGFGDANREATSFDRTLERLQRTAMAFIAMWVLTKVASGLKSMISMGLDFQRTMEDSKLGVATLFVATQEYTTVTGKALQGQRLWGAAMQDSTNIQQQLQVANLKTAATYEQLVRAYQMALPLGSAGGFNKEQVLSFSTAVVQAASAMMIPLDQLGEEIRSVLSGSMTDMHTRLKPLLTSMGIGNKEIKEAIKQGRLYEVVMKALSPAIQGADLAMNTFSTRLSNLKDAFSQILGSAFKGSFDALKQSFLDITNSLVQVTEVGGVMSFKLNTGIVATFGMLDSLLKAAITGITNFSTAVSNINKDHPVLVGFIALFAKLAAQVAVTLVIIQGGAKIFTLLEKGFAKLMGGGLVTYLSKLTGPIMAMSAALYAALGPWGLLAAAMATAVTAMGLFKFDEKMLGLKVAGLQVKDWLSVLQLNLEQAWADIRYGFTIMWADIEADFPGFARVINAITGAWSLFWTDFKSMASKSIDWVIDKLSTMSGAAQGAASQPGEPTRGTTGQGTWQEVVTTPEGSSEWNAVMAVVTARTSLEEHEERKLAEKRREFETAENNRKLAALEIHKQRTDDIQKALDSIYMRIAEWWPGMQGTTVPPKPFTPIIGTSVPFLESMSEDYYQKGPTSKVAFYQSQRGLSKLEPPKSKGGGGAGPIGASDIDQFLDQMEKKTITMYRELGDANYEFWANVKKDAGDSLGAAELEISKWVAHQSSEIWQQVVDSENKLKELMQKAQTKRGATPEALAIIAKAEAQVTEQRTIANDKYTNMLDEQARRYRDLEKVRLQELVDIAQLKVSYEELTGTTETLAIAQMKLIDIQAQLNKVGKSAVQQELISKNASVEATRKQIEASGTFLEGMSVGYQEWQMTITTAGQAGKQAFEALSNAMDGAADSLTEFTMTGKMSFSDFANSMIRDIMRIIYKMALMRMVEGIVGMIGSAAGGVAGGARGSAGSLEFAQSMGGGYHSGGTVGVTSVPLRDLPRFHSGLSSDEYPAILQRGETILPKGYHDKSSSKSGPEVQVIINNKTGKDVKHKETEPRFDGKRWVKEVVLELQQTDPSFRNQMRS